MTRGHGVAWAIDAEVWEEPVRDWDALWRQRVRWAEGAVRRVLEHGPGVLRSPEVTPLRQGRLRRVRRPAVGAAAHRGGGRRRGAARPTRNGGRAGARLRVRGGRGGLGLAPLGARAGRSTAQPRRPGTSRRPRRAVRWDLAGGRAGRALAPRDPGRRRGLRQDGPRRASRSPERCRVAGRGCGGRRRDVLSRVAVVFTGGTISMRLDPVAGGNVPTLDGAAILARTPGLRDIADVDADRPRPDAGQPLPLAGPVRDRGRHPRCAGRPAIDGAVVVQGTDTIEETAFFWDLVLDDPKPVVVTGAMRSSRAPPTTTGRPTSGTRSVRRPRPALRDQGVVGRASTARSSPPTTSRRPTPRRSTRSAASTSGRWGGSGTDGVGWSAARGPRRHVRARPRRRTRPARHGPRGDGRLAARRRRRGRRRRARGRGNGRRQYLAGLLEAARAGDRSRHPRGADHPGLGRTGTDWVRVPGRGCDLGQGRGDADGLPRGAEGAGRARARHRRWARPRRACGAPGRSGGES